MNIKYSRNYKRTTATITFSLPFDLIDELNLAAKKDSRFKNRSELAYHLFSEYIRNQNEEIRNDGSENS